VDSLDRKKELEKKWMRIWDEIGKRILKLPEYVQDIVLDDINTAVFNRLEVMEMIHFAKRKS